MLLTKEHKEVTALLMDAVRKLCKNSLQYRDKLSIEGILAITIDCEEVLLVNVNDHIGKNTADLTGSKDKEAQIKTGQKSVVKLSKCRLNKTKNDTEADCDILLQPKVKLKRLFTDSCLTGRTGKWVYPQMF